MNDDNKRLVQRWFEEVWNQNRESVIDELLSPEGVGFGLAATDTEVHGPTEFKPFMRNMRSAFPDLHIAVEDTVAEGDKVTVRLRVTGTHKGGWDSRPPVARSTSRPSLLFNLQMGGWYMAGTTGTNLE